jgi:hypothetical protein
MFEQDSKRHQEQATADKLRIESLLKQATQLESQLSGSQKVQTDLSESFVTIGMNTKSFVEKEVERGAERERQLKLKVNASKHPISSHLNSILARKSGNW